MHFATNNYRTSWQLTTHRMVWVMAFVAMNTALSSAAQAAGCAHRTENTAIGLDPFGIPLANNVLKVYSGGEFRYHVLPQGKPCNGPNCEGKPPINVSSIPQVITSERCDLTFLANNTRVGTVHYCNQFVFWPTFRPTSPVFDGLLRPPTV